MSERIRLADIDIEYLDDLDRIVHIAVDARTRWCAKQARIEASRRGPKNAAAVIELAILKSAGLEPEGATQAASRPIR